MNVSRCFLFSRISNMSTLNLGLSMLLALMEFKVDVSNLNRTPQCFLPRKTEI